MGRMKWKIGLERFSFDNPDYYILVFLASTVGIFILFSFLVFRLEGEDKRIQIENARMRAEEIVFDQRTEIEGKPPFLSWEMKVKP